MRKYISDKDLEEMDEKIKIKFLEQKKLNIEEVNKINSFTELIEKRMKEGKFTFGKTGYTVIGKKLKDLRKIWKV